MYVRKDLYCCYAYVGNINKHGFNVETKIKACMASVFWGECETKRK